MLIALLDVSLADVARYGDTGVKSPLCGQQVQITNKTNGKTVTVTIADACPTCDNADSIDLSVGAFTQIATEEEGEVPSTYPILRLALLLFGTSSLTHSVFAVSWFFVN